MLTFSEVMITFLGPTGVNVEFVFPSYFSDTIPLMTANSSVKVNLPTEHVISAKPKNAHLEPPAPVNIMLDFINLLLVFILSHNALEIQLREAPKSILATTLCPLLLA